MKFLPKLLLHIIAIFFTMKIISIQGYFDVEIKLDRVVYRAIGDKMTKFMNKTIKPCNDFYKFTCGNWSSVYNATKKIEKLTAMDIYDKTLQETLKDLLKEQHLATDMRSGVKVKNFYSSCTNSVNSYNYGTKQIIEFLQKEGGMPDLNYSWNENLFDWQAQIRKFKTYYGFDILIGAEIATDFNNKEQNKMYVGEMKLSELERHHYFQMAYSDKLDRYRNKIVYNLKKLGIDQDRAKRLAKEFIDLERDILKDSNEMNENQYLIPTNASALQAKHPSFNWSSYLTAIVGFLPFQNMVIEKNQKYIESVLRTVHFTPKRRLANYIMWKVAQNFLENSIDHFQTREDYCVNEAIKHFPKVLHAMLYTKFRHIVISADYKLSNITAYIRKAFDRMLFRTKWITEDVKKAIKRKTDYIDSAVLNYDEHDLDLYFYQTVEINDVDFFNNTINILRYYANNWKNKIYAKVENPVVNPMSINAYYHEVEKKIQLPIPTIFYPYFHVNYPKSMNFARIGTLIARALINIIEPEYYANINHDKNDFWTNETRIQYYENKRCFDSQIESNPMTKVIQEDISFGMTSAVDIAFNGYLLWLADIKNIEELRYETLPAFDFTNTQLFFVTFAQNWCKSIYQVLPSDGTIEILPSLINFNEFSYEFNCQQGSWMNPRKKCSVWNDEI